MELEGFNFWGKYQRAVEVLLEEQRILADVSNIIHISLIRVTKFMTYLILVQSHLCMAMFAEGAV